MAEEANNEPQEKNKAPNYVDSDRCSRFSAFEC